MIRHRPGGSGHPYSVDTEQRSPVVPRAGEELRLGVRASSDVEAVELELVRTDAEGAPSRRIPLERAAASSRGRVEDGGHLASAQARMKRAAGGWTTSFVPDAGTAFRYRFHGMRDGGRATSTRWHEVRTAEWREGGSVLVSGRDRIRTGSIRTLHDGARAWSVRFTLPLEPGEHVAGFGERYDRVDQRGHALDSVVFEQYKTQGAESKTYLPMPFAHVVGGDGWGFHIDTGRRVWFDVGAGDASSLVIEAEVGPEGDLPVRFYEGAPSEVLHGFLDDVGHPVELPDWVFGLWASGNEWNTQAAVMREMDLHREHGIPVSSVVIEAWSDESTFTAFRDAEYEVHEDGAPHRLADFRFPPDGAWPDPKGMVDELHSRGVRVHLWQIPLMKMRPHPHGQARADARSAVEADVLIREPDGRGGARPYRNRGWWFPLALMPDLTDERAASWWTEKRRYLVEEVGIDGFKTDGGEHAWGSELIYLDGRRGDEANSTYPVGYASAYGRLLESSGKPPVTFSRAGYTGSQAHGAFWAGDENSTWDAFRWSMNAGLTAAASGILYWGWDIAGFSGEVPDAELYLRAAAASVFVPVMQYHSEFNHHRRPSRDRTPWNIAEWTGDAGVISAFRRFATARERLVPYLAEQARTSIGLGVPLMRPLWFEEPDAAAAWEGDAQWMLGDDLVVAPILHEGAESRTLFLPRGEWTEVSTGVEISGPAVVESSAARDRIPVWVRRTRRDDLASAFEPLTLVD